MRPNNKSNDSKPGKMPSYDEFLANHHMGQGVYFDGKLKGGTESATTNPWASSVTAAWLRFSPFGLWDTTNRRPLFGWAPVLFGWLIMVCENSTFAEVSINGVPWKRDDGLIPWGDSKWALGPIA